tara:strand:- start:314 stop:484 length:171 start_codon:yes stop_codon:yes gene_type:complete
MDLLLPILIIVLTGSSVRLALIMMGDEHRSIAERTLYALWALIATVVLTLWVFTRI